MQFYRDGYRPGSPDVHVPAPQAIGRPAEIPETLDVLVVGAGPAGAVLSAQLSVFPEISTRVIERRPSPLEVGHADGVACRTVEMFQAFGLAEALIREAYWVNEVRFWGPSHEDKSQIVRTGWVEDTPVGLSEFPHVIVNQARMQQYLFEYSTNSPSRLSVDYGIEFVQHEMIDGDYPVAVTLRHSTGSQEGKEFTVRTKYLVGCDGARSNVRRALGQSLRGDAANHAWGVVDLLATTDFPDWRTKNVIQSAGKGSLLMIPREGGNMVRCYVDLGEVQAGDSKIRSMTAEQLLDKANAILHPYSINMQALVWSSVYEVGQRLADHFDDLVETSPASQSPRVFLTGDACHTHSAKAGQGMNVSMQDALNLGWKLASVLNGQTEATLLRSYSEERQAVAKDLIDFDKFWSSFIAQPALDPEHPHLGGVAPSEMQAEFARQGRYTAGLATVYKPSQLVGTGEYQDSASGFEIGTRFHSAKATRVADARLMELGHSHRADGRWRIYVFSDLAGCELLSFVNWLAQDAASPVRLFTEETADVDSVFDVHAIMRGSHRDVNLTSLPSILLPSSGPLGLQDWEKVWAAGTADDIFVRRGIGPDGAVVVVRPDQYVAHVLPLQRRETLTEFLSGVFVKQ